MHHQIIKFRAYLKGKMHYPQFVGFENGVLFWDWKNGDFNKNSSEVQLFTGLRDVEGRDIYEGDIVTGSKLFNFQGEFVAKVVYIPCGYQYTVKYPDGHKRGGILNNEEVDEHGIRIAGNIYENPELLK